MSSFNLKLIAIVTMLIDHIGAVLFPQYIVFRIIGRISFPIFCFLLTEGYIHTNNFKKYIIRLLIFAFISEIPYDLAFHNQILYIYGQNIFFTLFLGMILLKLIDCFKSQNNYFMVFVSTICICILAYMLKCDYGYRGILIILVFYIFKYDFKKMLFFQTLILLYSPISIFGLFAFIPIHIYNGKKGYNIKYLFYIFYPIHLFILYLIYYTFNFK